MADSMHQGIFLLVWRCSSVEQERESRHHRRRLEMMEQESRPKYRRAPRCLGKVRNIKTWTTPVIRLTTEEWTLPCTTSTTSTGHVRNVFHSVPKCRQDWHGGTNTRGSGHHLELRKGSQYTCDATRRLQCSKWTDGTCPWVGKLWIRSTHTEETEKSHHN